MKLKYLIILMLELFVASIMAFASDEESSTVVESGLYSINGIEIVADRFWENNNQAVRYARYSSSDIVPHVQNVSFGIIWSSRSDTDKEIKSSNVIISRGNLEDGSDFTVITNDSRARKTNKKYAGVITLDSPEDLMFKYYLFEVVVDGNNVYRHKFQIE